MKNSPLVRTPLQLVVRTSWQTSAYLTTQMPVQGLTFSASQTLDSKPTDPWVNSNTLRCNTSFGAPHQCWNCENAWCLSSLLKFSFYAWITDGKQRCLIQGGGIRRLLFTEACRQVNMALILTHTDETNGFCLCGLCGCLIGSGRLFVSLTEIRFIFVHYCYKASIKLEY